MLYRPSRNPIAPVSFGFVQRRVCRDKQMASLHY